MLLNVRQKIKRKLYMVECFNQYCNLSCSNLKYSCNSLGSFSIIAFSFLSYQYFKFKQQQRQQQVSLFIIKGDFEENLLSNNKTCRKQMVNFL